MTTLAKDAPRNYELGELSHVPVIAADIIYEGAPVGLVKSTGYGRPLVGVDIFAGFCTEQANNSGGLAGDKNARVRQKGHVQLSVSGAVITDLGQPVYATDDDTFVFLPTGASFIGYVRRFISAGVVIVEFNTTWEDPYGGGVYETITGAKTLDSEDSGKTFFVTATAVVTLPAVATHALAKVVCMGPYGTVQISLSPAAADSVEAPDVTAADNKDIINTLATSQRGDYAHLVDADGAGYVARTKGTWAREA